MEIPFWISAGTSMSDTPDNVGGGDGSTGWAGVTDPGVGWVGWVVAIIR